MFVCSQREGVPLFTRGRGRPGCDPGPGGRPCGLQPRATLLGRSRPALPGPVGRCLVRHAREAVNSGLGG